MDNLISYITDPQTIINLIAFVFGLGCFRANVKGKISKLEEDVKTIKCENNDLKVSLAKINTQLAEIQTSLKYIEKGFISKK